MMKNIQIRIKIISMYWKKNGVNPLEIKLKLDSLKNKLIIKAHDNGYISCNIYYITEIRLLEIY